MVDRPNVHRDSHEEDMKGIEEPARVCERGL